MTLSSMIRSRFRFAGELTRAAEVAAVLGKYGLAGWLTEVSWGPIHNALKSYRGEVLAEHPFDVRVRMALTDLGTTFVKLGQMLGTRPDLVGKELAAELSKLQEQTPPDPPEVVRKTVETELGRAIEECFKEFDVKALASASIGQVHVARLKNGRRAVVKVQHPGIEGTIRRDLDILGFLADIAQRNETLSAYQPAGLVREFSRTILHELDFRRELRNLQAFRRNFADDPTVVFPRPNGELTTGRILTMGRVQGHKLSDAQDLDKLEIKREELAKRGANVFVQMIFRDGFYHADPHPGNILVLPNGTIGLLDAGMVGRIDPVLRKQIVEILMAAGDRDSRRLTDAVLRLCGTPDHLDRVALGRDLGELFEEYGVQAVGQFDVSGALNAVVSILHRHKLILPGNVSMLIKCLILLEGTGRLLSPDFNLAELLEPWRRTLLREQFSPAHQFKEFRRIYADWARTAEAVPRAVTNLIDRLESGNFFVSLRHQHLKSAVNRLTTGLFISALLAGSSILMASGVRPLAWGVSVPGVVGYAASLVLGFRIVWANRDSRALREREDWE